MNLLWVLLRKIILVSLNDKKKTMESIVCESHPPMPVLFSQATVYNNY